MSPQVGVAGSVETVLVTIREMLRILLPHPNALRSFALQAPHLSTDPRVHVEGVPPPRAPAIGNHTMINKALGFLKSHLNDYLNAQSDWTSGESREDQVVFVDGEKMDPMTFKLGAVSLLLINIEQEKTLRPADRYAATSADGSSLKVQPTIMMNLYVLFVARFKQYEQGLSYLSRIIQHFQHHRVFDHHSAPELSEDIETLIMELITLPLAEQNDLWNALRTTYQPSILYKMSMVAFSDQDARRVVGVGDKDMRLSS